MSRRIGLALLLGATLNGGAGPGCEAPAPAEVGEAEGDTGEGWTVGAPCAAQADCARGFCLIDLGEASFPDGYCTVTCDPQAVDPCGRQAHCFDFGAGAPVCLQRCQTEADCARAGYRCVGSCVPASFTTTLTPADQLTGEEPEIRAWLSRLDHHRVLTRIRLLSGDLPWSSPAGEVRIRSRMVGHPDHALAVALLRSALTDLQLTVHEVNGRGQTLWAEVPGRDPTLPPVLVVTHYDSIAIDDDFEPDTDPAPGANDNGSGVAIALELLTVLLDPAIRQPPRSLRVVLTDREELGLVGAREYVAALPEEAPIDCSLIVDMVGAAPAAIDGRFWFVFDEASRSHAATGADALQAFVPDARIIPARGDRGTGSDSVPFWGAGLCSVSMYAWPYPLPCHTPNDTVAGLQPAYLERTTRAAAAVVAAWLYRAE